jgi:hypothetical protein
MGKIPTPYYDQCFLSTNRPQKCSPIFPIFPFFPFFPPASSSTRTGRGQQRISLSGWMEMEDVSGGKYRQ